MQCNATPRDKKEKHKNQRTKNNGHKEKSNEAQGPGRQDRLSTQNHTNYLTKGFKFTLSRGLVKMSAF